MDVTGHIAKILQNAHIPISTSAICHHVINIKPHGDQYCAGDPKGPNICSGDSGSGFAFKTIEWNEEKYYVHVSCTPFKGRWPFWVLGRGVAH